MKLAAHSQKLADVPEERFEEKARIKSKTH
jgi:hypothetical protein